MKQRHIYAVNIKLIFVRFTSSAIEIHVEMKHAK